MLLKEARQRAGLTQRQLSEALGFGTTQFVSNIERATAPIPSKHFRKINKILRIPIESLMDYNVERYRERMKREIDRRRSGR
jgi:transcriptional regulator with XRE-family HTH domain